MNEKSDVLTILDKRVVVRENPDLCNRIIAESYRIQQKPPSLCFQYIFQPLSSYYSSRPIYAATVMLALGFLCGYIVPSSREVFMQANLRHDFIETIVEGDDLP